MDNVTSYDLTATVASSEDSLMNITANNSLEGNTGFCPENFNQNGSKTSIQVAAQVIVAFLMLGLGCTTDFKLMWKYIKTPKQILTGLVLQLVFLPLLGLALSRLFMMCDTQTMGTIILASCPGGVNCNVVNRRLDADVDLSVALSGLSTLLAMATLPFWLFVLPKITSVNNECFGILFSSLGLVISITLLSLIVGATIKWKFPKLAFILSKVCSLCGAIAILVGVIFMTVKQGMYFVSNIYWKTLLFCLSFAVTSIVCSYLTTRIPWLAFNVSSRKTIVVATAMKNSFFGATIAVVSYNMKYRSYFGSIITISFLYGILQLGITLIFVIIYWIINKFRQRHQFHQENRKKVNKTDAKGVVNETYSQENQFSG